MTGTSHAQDLAAPGVNLQEAKAQKVAVSELVTAQLSGQLDLPLPQPWPHSGFSEALLRRRTKMVSKHLDALETSWNVEVHHLLLKSYRGRVSGMSGMRRSLPHWIQASRGWEEGGPQTFFPQIDYDEDSVVAIN